MIDSDRQEIEERARLQARLLDAVGQAIIATDLTGSIIYWNRAAESLYGWQAEEVLGRDVTEVTPTGASRDQAAEIMAHLAAGQRWSGEFPVQRRDGTTFPAIVSDTPVQDEDGNLVAIIGITTDISERKRMESELARSEALLEGTQALARLGGWEWDARLNQATWTDGVYDIYGVGRDFDTGDLDRMLSFYVEEDRERVRSALRACFSDGEAYDFEVGFINAQGRPRWCRTLGVPIVEEGQVTGARGYFMDITEAHQADAARRAALAALQESRRLLDETGEMARIGGWEHNLVTGEATWTRALYDIIEVPYDQDPPGAEEHLRYYPGEYRRILERAYNLAIEEGIPFDLELQVYTTTQRLIWCQLHGEPVYQGDRCIAVRGVFQDITARKMTEEQLHWQMAADAMIAELSQSLLASASIEEISELALKGARDLTDSPIGYVGFIDPETGYLICPTMTREVWPVCQVEEKSIVFEEFGGLWGWVLDNREPMMTNRPSGDPRSSGTPAGHIPIQRFLSAPAMIGDELVGQIAIANSGRDYTARDLALVERIADIYALTVQKTRAQQQLEAYAGGLEEMVAQRTQELRDAQDRLMRREKLAMLGQLAGSINHELRGPLSNISNAAYLLDMVIEEPTAEARETLDMLQKEVRRANTIVSGILGLLRTHEPKQVGVDANALLQRCLDRTEIPPSVKVVQRTEGNLPIILADSDQLEQVFGNLLSNAVEAMPEGGRLEIRTAVEDQTDLEVTIADTGAGISPKNLDKVFQPLFTTKATGVGLGLALVKTLVEGHLGTIAVDSRLGEGTSFTVRLPINSLEGGKV